MTLSNHAKMRLIQRNKLASYMRKSELQALIASAVQAIVKMRVMRGIAGSMLNKLLFSAQVIVFYLFFSLFISFLK